MSQGLFKNGCYNVAYTFEIFGKAKISQRGMLRWIVLCPHERVPGTMTGIFLKYGSREGDLGAGR